MSGAFDTCMADITAIDDTAPAITCPADQTAECTDPAGASIAFSATADHNCSMPAIVCTDAWRAVVNSGDTFPIGATGVTCTATDAAGNAGLCPFNVNVTSTPPVITSTLDGTPLLALIGTAVDFTVSFSDNPGDSHTADWDFGDGNNSNGNATGSLATAGHPYAAAGIYTTTVTITDRCGNSVSDEIVVVVYDPSAGFTTGGGWFVPDSESYIDGVAITDTESRANFGFIVKYKWSGWSYSRRPRFFARAWQRSMGRASTPSR